MTPARRRLLTAVTVLLALTGLAAFAVGRASRASEREALVSRTTAEQAAFRAAERESFARAVVRGHTAGARRARKAAHRAGKAHATRVVQARAAAVAVAQARAQAAQAASDSETSGGTHCCARPSGVVTTSASASLGPSKATGSSSSSHGGSESGQADHGSSDNGAGGGDATRPVVTATNQRRSTKPKTYSGTGSPTASSSSPETYRRTRTTRWRSEWSSSASGTTYRYSAKTTTRTTATSGGKTTTRVGTSRKSWSSSS
jgi:hypothetical protein